MVNKIQEGMLQQQAASLFCAYEKRLYIVQAPSIFAAGHYLFTSDNAVPGLCKSAHRKSKYIISPDYRPQEYYVCSNIFKYWFVQIKEMR
ncbi:hypothetical protein RWE15_16545 [Virgibacillus halophilus]|uniref:Uncharacterized protein n=1 Tax=Tigheibacillus halophilus TaxID=361280 RepID=A0ABU5C8R4_9BACI|nr:hypothetical protein [Virgibacillus halophilus]